MKFRTIKFRGQYKVVPLETQVIFTGTIVFKKLSTVFPPIPRHRFFLLDFNILYARLNRDDILTDVIGHITVVQQLESKQINQRLAQKCDIHIENIRFSTYKVPVKILSPSSRQANEAEILRTTRRVTIDELAFLDPDLYKNDTFLCKVSVKRFDTRYDWWYNACPSRVKQMHKDPSIGQLIYQPNSNTMYKVNLILEDNTNEISALIIGKAGEKLFGMPCKDLVMNQRLIDQQQLPNEFLRLIGQKKIFHLRFGNRKNSFNSSDVLVYNVSDDTTIKPIIPHILPRAVIVSSTTVSSSTSPPETSEESHKRKREESARKALFTGSEQSEVGEISEVDPKEFDEMLIKLLEKKSPSASAKTDSWFLNVNTDNAPATRHFLLCYTFHSALKPEATRGYK
ncbi:unnamed protein product [Malus baccata var. baccata]